MTHPAPDARMPRPAADYRWTDNKAFAFLQALAQHGKVAAAARAVGMTRQSAYRLKGRVPALAEAWVKAQAIGRARRRGAARKPSPCPRKATLPGLQSDSLRRQGDTLASQGDGSRLQGDGFERF